MVKYLAQCSLLFTSIVVSGTSGCYSHVQYLAPGGIINGTSNIWQVHQMQQEPDNPQAWSHECTDSNNQPVVVWAENGRFRGVQ